MSKEEEVKCNGEWDEPLDALTALKVFLKQPTIQRMIREE